MEASVDCANINSQMGGERGLHGPPQSQVQPARAALDRAYGDYVEHLKSHDPTLRGYSLADSEAGKSGR
jgi:hypothetical protein